MRISVLIPTRNRLDYLRQAVETVLRQDDPDCEIVVSDNQSEEDVAGYVESLGDPRIRYVRSERFLHVTDNWNRALEHSTGDYVVMLGDDDGLLPGYTGAIRALVAEFSEPDVIYTSALLYAYPGVMPSEPAGYLQPYGYATFLGGAQAPFVLPRERARELVAAAMDFRVRYGFNSQFLTVRRRALDAVGGGGPAFRSPFPDYYMTNMLFLQAERIVVEPHPRVVIGVTPKSYGYFYSNAREDEGRAFLEGSETPEGGVPARPVVPGSNINTGWLHALHAVSDAVGRPADLRPNDRRYRRLQLLYAHEQFHVMRTITRAQLDEVRAVMSRGERLVYGGAGRIAGLGARVLPAPARALARRAYTRAVGQLPDYYPQHCDGTYASMLDVFDRFEPPAPAGDAG